MIVEKETFWFSEPDIIGSAIVNEENREIFRGIIPPRYDKSHQQHPIASCIFNAIGDYTPKSVTFWGVGFTRSDSDLIEIYRGWCDRAIEVTVIHPHPTSEITDAESLFNRTIVHLERPEDLV